MKNKAVGTVFGLGGGAKKICANFFYITLTYKMDTILFISISVISKINRAISLFYPYLYTLIYVLLFFNSSFFWLAKYWGGGVAIAPPAPPPCSYGHEKYSNLTDAGALLSDSITGVETIDESMRKHVKPRSHLAEYFSDCSAAANNRKPIEMMKMQCVTIFPNIYECFPDYMKIHHDRF